MTSGLTCDYDIRYWTPLVFFLVFLVSLSVQREGKKEKLVLNISLDNDMIRGFEGGHYLFLEKIAREIQEGRKKMFFFLE